MAYAFLFLGVWLVSTVSVALIGAVRQGEQSFALVMCACNAIGWVVIVAGLRAIFA